ncbi:MAG: hypothetical protein PVF83_11975 [Anaerolineales bacterium]|jgi:hypothetical protein
MEPNQDKPNQLGNASLYVGIASVVLVFGIGLCAITGVAQGWVKILGTPLYVCGTSSAFLGLIVAGLGVGGLLGRGRAKSTAIAGLLLGLLGMCIFIFVVNNVGG